MSPETLTMADRYPEEHASQALEEDHWQHFEAQRHSSDATALTTSS